MPQREECACFTGHRELDEEELPGLRQALELTLEAAWAQGYRYFYNGGALGFDLLAAEAVMACKRRHAETALEIVVPHAHQSVGWPETERSRYERLCYLADRVKILSPLYYRGCYHVRNRYMVDRSGLCLCYFTHAQGGTAYTAAYAAREGVRLVNLALESSWQAFAEQKKTDG